MIFRTPFPVPQRSDDWQRKRRDLLVLPTLETRARDTGSDDSQECQVSFNQFSPRSDDRTKRHSAARRLWLSKLRKPPRVAAELLRPHVQSLRVIPSPLRLFAP